MNEFNRWMTRNMSDWPYFDQMPEPSMPPSAKSSTTTVINEKMYYQADVAKALGIKVDKDTGVEVVVTSSGLVKVKTTKSTQTGG
jgi:spermidine/putrescine-binding protein